MRHMEMRLDEPVIVRRDRHSLQYRQESFNFNGTFSHPDWHGLRGGGVILSELEVWRFPVRVTPDVAPVNMENTLHVGVEAISLNAVYSTNKIPHCGSVQLRTECAMSKTPCLNNIWVSYLQLSTNYVPKMQDCSYSKDKHARNHQSNEYDSFCGWSSQRIWMFILLRMKLPCLEFTHGTWSHNIVYWFVLYCIHFSW